MSKKVNDLIAQPTRKAMNAITRRFNGGHRRPDFYRRLAPRVHRIYRPT